MLYSVTLPTYLYQNRMRVARRSKDCVHAQILNSYNASRGHDLLATAHELDFDGHQAYRFLRR